MQYYTAQQLRGAARYKPAVLIGNWNEVQFSIKALSKITVSSF
jgi:hypothetical protein